jgi:hypothetical protein
MTIMTTITTMTAKPTGNRPIKVNFKKSRSNSAKKNNGNNKEPFCDNSDELNVINRVEKSTNRRKTGSSVGNFRQEKIKVQPQQQQQNQQKRQQQRQTQPPKQISRGRGQQRSSGDLESSGSTPIGGAVGKWCEAFGLALTAVVLLLDQHWPSISTYLNIFINGANSHG